MPPDPYGPQIDKFKRRAQRPLTTIAIRAKTKLERAAQLRAYWRLGQLTNRLLDQADDAPRLVERLAESIGRHWSWLWRARKFADAYTRPELSELCASADKLGLGHVFFLLSVDDKARRKDLQRQAAQEGWGSHRLWREIRGARGEEGRKRGRHGVAPTDSSDALRELDNECVRFMRRAKQLLAALEEMPAARARLRAAEMGVAVESLERVRDAATEGARALKKRTPRVIRRHR